MIFWNILFTWAVKVSIRLMNKCLLENHLTIIGKHRVLIWKIELFSSLFHRYEISSVLNFEVSLETFFIRTSAKFRSEHVQSTRDLFYEWKIWTGDHYLGIETHNGSAIENYQIVAEVFTEDMWVKWNWISLYQMPV